MTRKTSRGGQKIGNDVGAITNGYVRMFVDGDQYSQHRLKWKYHYGKDPNGPLDHINGNRADNRLCNLRETNPLENARNKHVVTSNTGHLGVSYCKRYRRFKADIGVAGRIIHLGGYLALECAVAARQHAERFLYGYTLAELRRAA